MSLIIEPFILGPIENNTFLIVDLDSKEAAIIDPSIPSRAILAHIRKNGYSLKFLLVTHAHFDHVGGVSWFKTQFGEKPETLLHPADLDLWNSGGGSKDFGFNFNTGNRPDLMVEDNQIFQLGSSKFVVLHTPGHTPGHVTYYFKEAKSAFCGDLIFFHGVGRTDLRYSNEEDLLSSIKDKIFTLPDETVLFPGHGPSTSVVEEKENNPFLI